MSPAPNPQSDFCFALDGHPEQTDESIRTTDERRWTGSGGGGGDLQKEASLSAEKKLEQKVFLCPPLNGESCCNSQWVGKD